MDVHKGSERNGALLSDPRIDRGQMSTIKVARRYFENCAVSFVVKNKNNPEGEVPSGLVESHAGQSLGRHPAKENRLQNNRVIFDLNQVSATRSISVGSSPSARELFTRIDTGHACK
jgi:hypothetical protein